jgi:hypothetical protein
MRGEERRQRAMLMIAEPGDRVPKKHSLRRGKEFADAALTQPSPLFDEMYSAIGRPSILPVRLLKASLLRRSTPCAANGCSASSSITTCCSAGSSLWMWPSRASTIRPSCATARGCWSTTWRTSFSPAWSRRPAVCSCLRTNTLPWMARWSRPGRRSRASSPGTRDRLSSPTTPATRRLTSTASAAATRLINRPPTLKLSWRRRGRARKRSCATRPMV